MSDGVRGATSQFMHPTCRARGECLLWAEASKAGSYLQFVRTAAAKIFLSLPAALEVVTPER